MGADGRNVTSISQSRNISAFVPAWSTVFRESIIELGSVAPSSVVNPADAVQIIGGRPVIGSERIRRHARRKVREPRPPQRLLYFPSISRHKCLFSASLRLCGEFLIPDSRLLTPESRWDVAGLAPAACAPPRFSSVLL